MTRRGAATLAIVADELAASGARMAAGAGMGIVVATLTMRGALGANALPSVAAAYGILATLDPPWLRRSWILLSAPLYGRELARALTLASGLRTLPLAGGAALAFILGGAGVDGALRAAAGAALVSMTVAAVTLCAALRHGSARWLYVGLAGAAGAALVAAHAAASPASPYVELLLAASVGFAALRAFGEALARYDPVAESAR